MKLGEKVRRARTAQKMTLTALGASSGLSKGFISQVESGRANPSIESLGRMAAALHLDLSELLHDTAKPRPNTAASPNAHRGPEVFRSRSDGGSAGASAVRELTRTGAALYSVAVIQPGDSLAAQPSHSTRGA